MPQDRILYTDNAAWRVERVVKHAGVRHAGNAIYRVATPRWVFPVSGVSEFHMEGRQVLLDGLTVVALPAGLSYRFHEWQSMERSHMVVSMQPGSAPVGGPGQAYAWSLPPRALWQWRLHWRALARGDERAVGSMPGPAAPGCRAVAHGAVAHAAVVRARHFMATRTAVADGLRWSLHDVADAACCSYFHLARLFRAYTGRGLHDYREQLRLAMALQRLEEGEGDLAALAHDLGYSSQSHLGTALRREVRVTPAQARKVLRG